jgi:hypothetical protein
MNQRVAAIFTSILLFLLTGSLPSGLGSGSRDTDLGIAMPVAFAQDSYDRWRDRMTAARKALEELRGKRRKAQEEYEALLRQRNLRSFPVDPNLEASVSARIRELDQSITDKEYEISSTIPDEARRAGVPPGVLAQ